MLITTDMMKMFPLICMAAWSVAISTAKKSPANTSENNSAKIIQAKSSDDFRVQYAAQMLSFMNRSVLPCDDFYEYACGNWKNVIEPRHAKNKRSYLLDIEYKLTDIAKEILELPNIANIAPEYDEEFQLTKKFYHNCLQTDLKSTRKSSEYLQVLQQIGGFPALQPQWNAGNFSWLNMSAHMSNYAINGLVFEGTVSQYPFDPYFGLPSFGFGITLNNESIANSSSNAYKTNNKRMRDILSLYDVAEDNIDGIVGDIFDFLKAVLKIFQEFDDNGFKCQSLSDAMDVSRTDAVTEKWQAYYEIAWEGKVECVYKDQMPCSYLYYELDLICEKYKEAVANYLSLKFLYHMDAQLEDEAFHKDYCAMKLRNVMDDLFDHLYIKIYADRQALDEVKTTIAYMKPSLRTIVEEADWLDEETREAALLKESKMGTYVGRYEDPAKTKRIIGELKNLKFVDGNYEANNLNLRQFQKFISRYNGLHFEEFGNSTKPVALLRGMQPNAFYYNNDNAMYVMAGVLHPPIFHKSWPNSLKFGTLGFSVGHEFTHAFDTFGAKYDHDGVKHYWWSEESGDLFKERADCFVERFNQFYIPEINRNINGNDTRDENIADAGGLRIALMAYRRFVKDASKSNKATAKGQDDERLPGLDLTPEQLFFLGAAQLWCSSYEEAHYLSELTNEHTIDKFRVLGMDSNNADFASAYNCPLGSAMNPSDDRCIVW